jgi:SAM-dependent methyltransferase
MSLSDEYKRQFGWRAWTSILDSLPSLHGQTLLDLGCGVGDLTVELVERGARVIGIDINEEFLQEARSRGLKNAEFRSGDLRSLEDPGVTADGLWCSFAAAYFPDLPAPLSLWGRHLRPGGWIALTEIDDLFGHEPLGAEAKSMLEAYARDALAAGRYDFQMGRKLPDHLERSGYTVSKVLALRDQELAFDGPALPEVADAWRARLDRMKLLRDFCGPSYDRIREEFMGCLTHPRHRSVGTVCCCIATRRGAPAPVKLP